MKNLNFLKNSILLIALSILFVNCNSENNPKSESSSEISLTTSAITNITSSSAKCGGTIVSVGNNNVIQKGVVWSTSPTPTINLTTKTYDGNGIDSYSSNISGLIPNTKYYVRAYVTTNSSTLYGNEVLMNTEFNNLAKNLKNGLVAWYPFNENAIDGSGNNNSGTIYGATLTADRFGNQKSAFSFNGTGNYISVTNSTSLSNLTSVTISGWYYTSDFTTEQGLVTKWFAESNCSKNTDAYTCILSRSNYANNRPTLVGATNVYPGYQLKTPNSIPLNAWTHFVFTHDSSTGGSLYINGVLVVSLKTNIAICSSTNPLLIGADNNMNTIYRFLNGKLDDIGIWNRALTSTEVQQLYTMQN
jgi:hypothetical protein